MSLALSTRQVAFLRSRAHDLEARLQLGKAGSSEAFRAQLGQALARDELVKVRLGKHVEDDLDAVAAALGAVVVQRVGRVAALYRPAEPPRLELPDGA